MDHVLTIVPVTGLDPVTAAELRAAGGLHDADLAGGPEPFSARTLRRVVTHLGIPDAGFHPDGDGLFLRTPEHEVALGSAEGLPTRTDGLRRLDLVVEQESLGTADLDWDRVVDGVTVLDGDDLTALAFCLALVRRVGAVIAVAHDTGLPLVIRPGDDGPGLLDRYEPDTGAAPVAADLSGLLPDGWEP